MNGYADMITIVNALTLGQLATFNHVLKELEASGITDLHTARKILNDAETELHLKFKKNEKKYSVSHKIKRDNSFNRIKKRKCGSIGCKKFMKYCPILRTWNCSCGYSEVE